MQVELLFIKHPVEGVLARSIADIAARQDAMCVNTYRMHSKI